MLNISNHIHTIEIQLDLNTKASKLLSSTSDSQHAKDWKNTKTLPSTGVNAASGLETNMVD